MPFVTGVGWISAQSMGEGRKNTLFQMDSGELPSISRPPCFEQGVFKSAYPRFSRMDEFSRLGVSAVGLALQDAGLDRRISKQRMGIVVTTVYGCLHTDLDYFETVMPENGAFASPALFSYTLPNCFLGEAASRFGLTGPGYVVSPQGDSDLSSTRAVLEDMDCEDFESALAGICDLGCPPDFPVDINITPGAAFVVVQKSPDVALKPYGSLRLNPAQEILFNEKKVTGFSELVQACMKQIPGIVG
jgi:3-oxoacyl-[acyl-carrier-protein] synthase II